MLSHLCEFSKLSSDIKYIRKELIRAKRKNTLKRLNIIENNKYYIRNKTKNEKIIEKKPSQIIQ